MTRAKEIQQWLRKHGPATSKDLEQAGFKRLILGRTGQLMIQQGAVEKYTAPNPDSAKKYARVIVTFYEATDKDYEARRGRKPSPKIIKPNLEATFVLRAISILTNRGYTVIRPPHLQNAEEDAAAAKRASMDLSCNLADMRGGK